MNFDQWTVKAREAIDSARAICISHQHQQLSPSHLFLALLQDQDGLVPQILSRANVDLKMLSADLMKENGRTPVVHGTGQIYFSSNTQKAIDSALKYSKELGDSYLSTESLLLGLLSLSPLRKMVEKNGADISAIKESIDELRQGTNVQDENPESKMGVLEKYCVDLSAQAHLGLLDPIIGRDEEIRRAMQVLSRRTKNNPVLIGEPGVGKTAIAEGIAQRIANGDVPESLQNKKLLSLDLASLVAGAKYRGEFEERLKTLLKALQKEDGQSILFIDELHTLVGAGKSDGAMDASNMLKPALARGKLRCIGATTLDEYRQYIEKDSALERRFQPIVVEEPNVEDAISILRGLKERYELHHGIRIQDASIITACTLSNRYISGRKMPDKAIDLIDEAASALKMQIESIPVEIDEIEREISRLEIAKEALKRESDQNSINRLKETELQLAETKEKAAQMRGRWLAEKEAHQSIIEVKERIEEVKFEIQKAQKSGHFEEAAKLQYGELPELEKEQYERQQELENINKNGSFLEEEVTPESIAKVVARWTGIPVAKMLEGEQERLLEMEQRLTEQVIGQKEAIQAVSDAIRRSRAGLSDENRPIGSFLFLGPTGVGKTELAKALATFLFDEERALLRIDMSEYMEKHSVSRLIGSPPGYVGYEQGGQLTELVRRRPYAVILLDEIEKAHSDIFNILLQLLDDGRLTDGQGRTVDFRNTVILMTSNIGSDHLLHGNTPENQNKVMQALKASFRPELLNRIDDIVMFHALDKNHLKGILEIQLEKIQERLRKKELHFSVTELAKNKLIDLGYDPIYGARPLKRVLQKHVIDALAKAVLAGKLTESKNALFDLDVDNLKISFEERDDSTG